MEGVQAVEISLIKGQRDTNKMADVPASYNEEGEVGRGEYQWVAGQNIGNTPTGEGDTYSFHIQGMYQNQIVFDRSDSVFSILDCRG